ncbi:MAG: suppressor of fused domain protein [Phycisphaerales bacterium]|nr:suppressor of fused domain protein [Phycisphaerales bacterium]
MSSPVETACPMCGKRYRVRPEFIGRSGTCRSCGTTFEFQPAQDVTGPADYMEGFRAVQAQLEARLGPSNGRVCASPIPLYLDLQRGRAESLCFEKYIPGFAFCTCALSLHDQQPTGAHGNYELMMCAHEPLSFAPECIGAIGAYSLTAVIDPGHTIDLGPNQPPHSNMRGLLAWTPELKEPVFQLYGRPRTIVLLIGVTEAEMNACREYGPEGVVLKLKARGEFPYTTLERRSLV